MVGRMADSAEGAKLGIVGRHTPRGCVRQGRIDPPRDAGRSQLATQIAWIALALLLAGLLLLALS